MHMAELNEIVPTWKSWEEVSKTQIATRAKGSTTCHRLNDSLPGREHQKLQREALCRLVVHGRSYLLRGVKMPNIKISCTFHMWTSGYCYCVALVPISFRSPLTCPERISSHFCRLKPLHKIEVLTASGVRTIVLQRPVPTDSEPVYFSQIVWSLLWQSLACLIIKVMEIPTNSMESFPSSKFH